jgi:predicted nuclease of predicted toxin-antitoxin system
VIVKFKIDENLPIEFAELLIAKGHDALTVFEQRLQGEADPAIADVCVQEGRVLVTLDLGFADLRAYPPRQFSGFIVLRVGRQDKRHLLDVFRRCMPLIGQEPLEYHLWIVEETRVRIRGEE